jgi:molecular chaperone GrpE
MSAKKKNEHSDPAAEPENEQTAPEAPETEETKPEAETKEQQAAPAPAEEKPQADSERYLRLMAEFDNYKKRSARERENIYTDVRVDTVTKFLPVFDNLERALKTETADEAYKKGVEMTFNQLMDVFRKLGVEEIESVGKTFDPAVHNAVMHVEDDAHGENEIVEEFQKGFKIGDKVIRHSMVKVAN